MQPFKLLLCGLTLTVGLAGSATVANAQPVAPQACGDQVVALIDRMAYQMRTLAEDVRVEVRDGRAQALSAQAYGLLEQISHMQREAQVAGPEHMREEAAELDRKFHEFIEATEALGPQGRYLTRSAERVEDLDHELLRVVAGPLQTVPAMVPAAPTGFQRAYAPPYRYQTSYRGWTFTYRR
jgi:hypothetical protein